MTGLSVPVVTEMVDVALRSYLKTPTSESKLTNPEDVQEVMRGLKVSKGPGPNGIQKGALKHLTQRAVSPLVLIFIVILLTRHFPTAWKHARVISLLKPGRIQHYPHPIAPLVFWTLLVKS